MNPILDVVGANIHILLSPAAAENSSRVLHARRSYSRTIPLLVSILLCIFFFLFVLYNRTSFILFSNVALKNKIKDREKNEKDDVNHQFQTAGFFCPHALYFSVEKKSASCTRCCTKYLTGTMYLVRAAIWFQVLVRVQCTIVRRIKDYHFVLYFCV